MADTPDFMSGPLASLSLKRLQELCASVRRWNSGYNARLSATKADCILIIEEAREHYREEQLEASRAQAKQEEARAKREASIHAAADQARGRRNDKPPSPARGFTGITASEANEWFASLPPTPLAGEA